MGGGQSNEKKKRWCSTGDAKGPVMMKKEKAVAQDKWGAGGNNKTKQVASFRPKMTDKRRKVRSNKQNEGNKRPFFVV